MHSYKEYYTYLGYTYILEYDEDEDTRKNMHVILDPDKNVLDWKDVPDSRDAAIIEIQVGQFERAVRRSMLQVSTPAQDWCYFAKYARHVQN